MCQSADPRQHITRGLLALTLLMLAGCASTPAPIVEAPVDEPMIELEAPVESIAPEQPLPEDEQARTFALPEESTTVIDPSAPVDAAATPQAPASTAAAPRTSSPAVVALLDAAAEQASNGDADQAAATLERALRIEPSNATLWHRLAVLRMQQGQYEQAMELAMRSNSLARGDAALLDANRQVLEQCRAALARTQRG